MKDLHDYESVWVSYKTNVKAAELSRIHGKASAIIASTNANANANAKEVICFQKTIGKKWWRPSYCYFIK